MNRLATSARIAGIVTVSMFVVLISRTPASTPGELTAEAETSIASDVSSTYLPAQYVDEEKAAQASELPAQF